MQQPARNTTGKKTKYLDAKVLIATLSIAVTFGLWNIFSNEAVQAEKASPAEQLSVPPQPPANAAQGFPPLPTLVPLADVNTASAPASPANAALANGQNNSQAAGLRSVTAPSLVIQQKNKPLIDAPVLVSSGGGGGRSGGSGPAPVTSTRSSRR